MPLSYQLAPEKYDPTDVLLADTYFSSIEAQIEPLILHVAREVTRRGGSECAAKYVLGDGEYSRSKESWAWLLADFYASEREASVEVLVSVSDDRWEFEIDGMTPPILTFNLNGDRVDVAQCIVAQVADILASGSNAGDPSQI